MIILSILHYQIEQLKQQIEHKMNYNYVDKYIDRPQIDQFQLELLYIVANEMKFTNEETRAYLTATMLVQAALNAHELVKNEETHFYTERQKKEKQLLVLAGDYYSGLYYLLLAEMKDIEMVGCLAKGIKKINEQKMQLYYKEYDSVEELIQLLLSIHSTMIAHVSGQLFSPSVSTVMEKLVQLQFLCKEEKRMNDHQYSLISSHLEAHAMEHVDHDERQVLHGYIRKYVNEFEVQIQDEHSIPTSLTHLVQQFLNSEVYDISSMAEEG